MTTKDNIKNRLDYLRQEIEAERISTAEILEIESLKQYIDPADVLLSQWAGVNEEEEEREINDHIRRKEQIYKNLF